MQIYNELTEIKNSSLALGFFDGLHLGHRVVLKNAINVAKKNNCNSTVIMFKEHPLNFLTNDKISLLLTLNEKLKILEAMGIDNVVLLDFEEYSHINAQDYLKNVIIKYFSPIAITTGFNHTFGFNREGNSNFFRNNSEKYGYKYYEIPPFVVNETIVSSSAIKNKLSLGDFFNANKLLGYEYFIQGIVEKGDKIASKLGYSSANIKYPEEKIQIPHGVYYVLVYVKNKKYNGILNYGYAPTISENSSLKTEVHIIDFNQNIYGENIRISFVTKIRNQIKFDSIEKLKEQIKRDIAFAEVYQHFVNDETSHFF